MDRIGYVYFNNLFAGKITESTGIFEFVYDSNYMRIGCPIGFNFPFTQSKYMNTKLFPIFENLISEGWLLDLQSSIQHIDINNKFEILLNNGQDLVGSITIEKELI